MHSVDARRRLQFDEQAAVNDQINALAWYADASIVHDHCAFTFEFESARVELEAHRFLANLLEKSRPKLTMNLNGGPDDRRRDVFRCGGNRRESKRLNHGKSSLETF